MRQQVLIVGVAVAATVLILMAVNYARRSNFHEDIQDYLTKHDRFQAFLASEQLAAETKPKPPRAPRSNKPKAAGGADAAPA
jgi:hypothetical protein